jgi:hypothetical protein
VISLIHPSRGRPDKAVRTAQKWIDLAGTDVEHILSLDESDDWQAYKMTAIVGPNSSVVEATNRAAKVAKGNILLYLSDDFDCFKDWGKAIETTVKDYSPMWLLKVDDCLQKFDVPVLTIPIMSKALYEKLGYFWHPGYRSMFVDEDLFWTCRKLGVIKNAEHLKFQHNHVSVGRADDDETYRRSAANWEQGKKLFFERKAQGFPL